MAGFDTTDTSYEYDTGGRLRRMSYDSENDSTKFFLWYDYDTAGRLWKIYANTSDSPPDSATAVYTYNARGQVTQEVIKSTMGTAVQTVDFTYNSRGLLTKINDLENPGTDRFALEIGYDGKVTGGPTTNWSAQKNGNISQIKWRNTKISANPFYYTFGYDSRDQLTKADRDSTLTFGDVDYTSDGNGNLATLDRGTAWTYCYDGDETNTNRVDDITNRGSDDNWDYDQSGRQTKDTWAGFTGATYHFPGAAFHNITVSGGELQMRYNGNNRRLQKKVVNGTTTNYVRAVGRAVLAVYDGTTIKERYIWGPTGLVAIVRGTNTSASWSYTITDHLGSVRSVVDSLGSAMAGYDYYPFGMILWSDVGSNRDSRFKFGAKEYDTELDLNLYYFEARFYNPEIGRFAAPDPLRQGWSHYAFCSNNPVRFIDPTGMITNDGVGEREYSGGDYGDGWSRPNWRDADYGPSYAYGGKIPFMDASGAPLDWDVTWGIHNVQQGMGDGGRIWLGSSNDIFCLDAHGDTVRVSTLDLNALAPTELAIFSEFMSNVGSWIQTHGTSPQVGASHLYDMLVTGNVYIGTFTENYTSDTDGLKVVGFWGLQMPEKYPFEFGSRYLIGIWSGLSFDNSLGGALHNGMHEAVHISSVYPDYNLSNCASDDRANDYSLKGINWYNSIWP